jgi:hypothetical protein
MLLLSLLLVPVALFGAERKPQPEPTAKLRFAAAFGVADAAPSCATATGAVADQGACSACAQQCSAKTEACEDGSIKSCYLAAACLCQCNLDAGGCGSSKQALRECVDENERLARELGDR